MILFNKLKGTPEPGDKPADVFLLAVNLFIFTYELDVKSHFASRFSAKKTLDPKVDFLYFIL